MAEPGQTYVQARIRDALVRVFDPSPDPSDGDISDMYVLEVFGFSVLIRRRPARGAEPEVFVHIDNESAPPTVLAVEVANGGDVGFAL